MKTLTIKNADELKDLNKLFNSIAKLFGKTRAAEETFAMLTQEPITSTPLKEFQSVKNVSVKYGDKTFEVPIHGSARYGYWWITYNEPFERYDVYELSFLGEAKEIR